MAQVAFVASSTVTYDLTAVATNPGAAAEVTPRQGGFVARNRINFANVTAPTLTNKVMNVLRILKVPARAVVEGVYLIGPRGTAGVTHNCNSKSISSGTAGIGYIAYKDASLSSASTDADGFGLATLAKSKIHTSSVLALPTDPETTPKGSVRRVVAGVAGAAQGWADGGNDTGVGMHFPYGGYITFQVIGGKGPSGTAASSLDGVFSGVLEVAATGWKVPE
ncbi:MAG: hypothetical protein KKF62_19690 [Bacteroidetes bacterium]|nr:hypothetical protein [Bacteroidota bacterium]